MKRTVRIFLMCWTLTVLFSPNNPASGDQASTKKKPESALPVKAIQVAPVSRTFIRKLPARVMTETETRLAFRVPGRIDRLPVTVGQAVEKGQLGASLDSRDFEDSAERAGAATSQAAARQKDADLHLERMQKLWANQDIDISQLDRARADARSSEDQVKMQQRELSEARRRLSYTRLTAPFTGFVAEKKVNPFDTVSAGQPVVFFVDLAHLKARAQLSPSLLPEAARFERYTLCIPALGDLRLPARLEGIGPAALPEANTYPITVTFDTGKRTDIRPGMNALLEITVGRRDSDRLIQIPAAAMDSDSKGNAVVWVINLKKGVVEQRSVSTGGLTQNGIEIKKGLHAGEWVVTAGLRNLAPGRKVILLKDDH